ncbi:MAG: response regulator [Burkholderiaceae bacterium]
MNVLPIFNGTVETYRLRGSTSAGVAQEADVEADARRPRALVVDDSPTVRHQLSLALLRMGVESEAVGNADDALRALGGYRYDLAILDVVIPGMDGFRLARHIKRDPKLRTTPVIMLTSRSSPWDLARGALAGCNSYLVKPVSPKSLRETILRNLAHGVQSRRRALAREEQQRAGAAAIEG